MLVVLLSLLVLSTTSRSETSQLDYNIKIRVGLKSSFEKVDKITVNNQSLLIGYEISLEYQMDQELTSAIGFVVSPATGYYLISEQFFATYDECLAKATVLRGLGYQASVGLASHGIWKVYIGSMASESDASTVKTALDGGNGLNYGIASDNGLRTKVEYVEGFPVLLENSGSTVQLGTNTLKNGIPVINLESKSYRGKMEIGRYNKPGVTAINVLPMNEYLYGVVSGEMPNSWPLEALKAQAVAARNYAMYYSTVNIKYPNEAYSICDTTISQVYKGYLAEVAIINQAVDETTGKMLYYNNVIIPANYFSTSGGHTEDSQNVWSGTTGYLKGVPDIYEVEPYVQPWIETKTAGDIKTVLAKYNINIGEISDIQVVTVSDSGRAMTLKIVGTSGEHEVSKEKIREYFGLKSRKFTLVKNGDLPKQKYYTINATGQSLEVVLSSAAIINATQTANLMKSDLKQISIMSAQNIYSMPNISGQSGTYLFVGQGSGHGAGLSQSGAKGMALAGFTYDEILEYYFTDTIVQ